MLQPQVNALGVELLEEPTSANRDGVQSLPLKAQPHAFDVSANSLSGAVPAFLYEINVHKFVQPSVDVQVRASGLLLWPAAASDLVL